MRFTRARYVTLCQQSLVTAAVLAVGLSAAGVKTLDIVPRPGTPEGGTAQAAPGTAGEALEDPGTSERSRVDTAPVTPKVREVSVTSTPQRSAARKPAAPAAPASPGQRSTAKKQQAPDTDPGFVQTPPEKVQGYATIGMTWKHGVDFAEDQIVVLARTETKGVWSKWTKVDYHDDHGPDAGTAEGESARERPGTDALIVGDVDRVQVRAQTTTGTLPEDMKLAIVDPGTGAMKKQAPAIDTAKLDQGKKAAGTPEASGTTTLEGEDGTSDDVTLSAMTRPAKPYIYSRAQWGANEKMREQSPPSYGTVKTGFIHHTVNSNNYTRAQVPALLRGIYAYHTQSRGWRDIGYNYLVDRFGRIWEGRWGGVSRAGVGAHTLGYNEVSFAMSAIGNFDIAKPPPAVVAAYTKLFAWKLAIYNIRANNPRVLVKGRYLHAINGHRDVGQTACPGRYLYARLAYVRNRARDIQIAAQRNAPATPSAPSTPSAPATFTSPTQTPRAAVSQPSSIAFPKARNLAGSAYPDLVIKSRSTGAIRVLPTAGQTGFRGVATTKGSWWAMDLLTAVGDVTGDGKGDVLARAAKTRITRIYRGDGKGHVARAGVGATTRFKTANMVVGAGDWDGDHKGDVLMRTRSGALYVLRGANNGTFGGPRLVGKGWNGYTSIASAGDVNGDGRADLVGLKNHVVYVALGAANARVGAARKELTLSSQWDALVGGGRDLTGDKVGDVVIHSRTGALKILPGRAGGFGTALGPFPFAAGVGMRKLSAGQLGGTAAPDVIGTNADGTRLTVAVSNGLSNIGKSMATNLRVPGATQVLSVGDWNKDGKADVITREAAGDKLVLRPGNGDGTFAAGVEMSDGWSTFSNLAAVGDVTGDRLPDLLGKTAAGKLTIFPSNGKTGFQVPILAPAALRTFNQLGSAAWRPGNIATSAFLSNDGAFVPSGGAGGGKIAGYDWVIGLGDVDGNGVADLVVRDGSGTLWLLPGTSRGYLERRFLASGYAGYSLGG
jgi:hypothetical protein